MNPGIKWEVKPLEKALIAKIVERAVKAAVRDKVIKRSEKAKKEFQLDISMDIMACHLNGCPLRLQDLLDAGNATFSHDVFGIRRFIDRNTGKIPPNKFEPRCHMEQYQKPRPKTVWMIHYMTGMGRSPIVGRTEIAAMKALAHQLYSRADKILVTHDAAGTRVWGPGMTAWVAMTEEVVH